MKKILRTKWKSFTNNNEKKFVTRYAIYKKWKPCDIYNKQINNYDLNFVDSHVIDVNAIFYEIIIFHFF